MTFPHRSCPVCHGDRREILYEQRFAAVSGQLQLAGYAVAVCASCGAAYADAIPAQDWFDGYYRSVSKYTHDQCFGMEPESDTQRFRDIADLLVRHVPEKDSRILDFGCASAGLLSQLRARGYADLLGADASPSAAKLGEALHGIRVVNAELDEIARNETAFDLIIQVGVLEHICDVDATIAATRLMLAPGGLVYIEVPDATAFADFPGAPFQQFSIEHINFFSRSSLTSLMERMGFAAVEVTRTARAHTLDAWMPVVCGVFQTHDGSRFTTVSPDADTRPALRRYVAECTRVEQAVAAVIDTLADSREPLLVWGVGTHTLHLIETTAFAKLNVRAFVDSNPNYQARELYGTPVIGPAAVDQYSERILISSHVFQTDIDTQIKRDLRLPNETIKLYDL